MPEFHMEHCVFAAFMSKGTSFKDCGKPCEKHSVELKDSYGNMHFLKADQECRNTMYRGSAQSAGFLVPKHSLGFWRFEALHERGETLRTKIQSYLNLLDGTQDYHTVASLIGSQEKYGVTEGQLTATASWRDRKKSQDISF
jgi:putative protease